MSRMFITGSSTGLGLMAGRLLAELGHQVVLHARDERRAGDAKSALPAATEVVIGDASRLKDLRRTAEQLNGMGRFDAVIHKLRDASPGSREPLGFNLGEAHLGWQHCLCREQTLRCRSGIRDCTALA